MKHTIALVALALVLGACGKKDPAPTPAEADTATAPAPAPDTVASNEAPDASSAPAASDTAVAAVEADTATAPAPDDDAGEAPAAAEDVAAAPTEGALGPDTAIVVKGDALVAVDAKTGDERVLVKPDGAVRSCFADPRAGVVWAVLGPPKPAKAEPGGDDGGEDGGEDGDGPVPLDGRAVFFDLSAEAPTATVIASGLADWVSVAYPDEQIAHTDEVLEPVLKLSAAPTLSVVVHEPDDPELNDPPLDEDEELMARKKALAAVKLAGKDAVAALWERSKASPYKRVKLPFRQLGAPLEIASEPCAEEPLLCGFGGRLTDSLWEVVVGNDRGDYYHEMQQLYDPKRKVFVDPVKPERTSATPFVEEDGLMAGISEVEVAPSGAGWLVERRLVMPARGEAREYALTCGWMGPTAVAGSGWLVSRDGAVTPSAVVPSPDELPEGATVTRWGVIITKEIAAAVAAADRDEADKALDAGRRPAETLGFFRIMPGMKVAELGAGGGYTSELLARVVGAGGADGKVYGNNSPFILERFAEKPWSERLKKPVMKVVTRLDTPFDAPFPKDFADMGKLDAVLIVLFYHDTVWQKVDRAAMNKAIFAALKPGGVYGVVDHAARPEDGTTVTETLHRIARKDVVDEIQAAGFVFTDESGFLRSFDDPRDWNAAPSAAGDKRGTSDRFVLLFRKPGGDDGAGGE